MEDQEDAGARDTRTLQSLVDGGDPDELLLAVDRLCANGQWDELADLARRCRAAVEVGRQLWGVASHIDYRLALEGPAPHAAAALTPGASRFTLGPLTEVAASTHEWASLAPYLPDDVTAATVAEERVLRGEDLRGEPVADAAAVPLALQPWEPAYALPTYRDRSAAFPAPAAATSGAATVRRLPHGTPLVDDPAESALRALVETWVTQSNGRSEAVCVRADAAAAVGALTDEAALVALSADEGLALGQWAAASGGAHGARRGGAAGRFAVWWALAALGGVPWPAHRVDESYADSLGEAAEELEWHRWFPPWPESGWVLRLAVSDPLDGLAWALHATDEAEA